jgi:hypothetical protein
MEVKTNVFLSESDIRMIIKKHLEREGYRLVGDIDFLIKNKNETPKGLLPNDVIGVNAEVKKQFMKRVNLPNK